MSKRYGTRVAIAKTSVVVGDKRLWRGYAAVGLDRYIVVVASHIPRLKGLFQRALLEDEANALAGLETAGRAPDDIWAGLDQYISLHTWYVNGRPQKPV